MRQPGPAEVIAAVAHVTGIDPNSRGQRRQITGSRRLAAQALSEIVELSQNEIAAWLGLERTTVSYHLHKPYDYDVMRMVIDRVSTILEADADALEARRSPLGAVRRTRPLPDNRGERRE